MQSEFRITTEVDPGETRIAEIEINKNCNLNCTMCNTQLSKRPNTYMDLGLFEESLLHAKRLGQTGGLALHTIGDPLIHPRLGDYLALLRKHELTILLSSNMLAFERKQETLREYADVIEKIRFSIDGASKETYEAIRRPGKFENLIKNLELFRTMNEGGRYFDQVAIDSVVSEDVRHELAYHVSFYSRYVPMRNIGLHLVNGLSPDNT
ncbi:MAG: radical SAM protein [Planctomycetota bacterium]